MTHRNRACRSGKSCAGGVRSWTSAVLGLIGLLMLVPPSQAEAGIKTVQDSGIQEGGIAGRVVDAETAEPLPGVNIVVVGTTVGTSTDADGYYEISGLSPGEYSVQSSFIGYTSHTAEEVSVVADEVTPLDFSLEASTTGLDEVVVVGYGTQEEVNLTGSIATTDAEFLENRPITNASQALQGIQGAYVNQTGGQPGADDATIRIRGLGTFGDNDPLVLVDGIEYSLRDVNPLDIESISVLKDAAAAAIYGNRAANGVVLITTKKGVKQQGIQTDYTAYYGVQEATSLPDMVTDAVTYMEVRNQASLNEDQPPPYSQEEIEEYRNGTDPDLYPNSDWYDIMIDPASMQEHNLRISGGGQQATYSFTLGYLDQNGVVMATDAEKYSLNSSLRYDITDRMTLGAKVSGTYWERNEMPFGTEAMMNRIARALPIHPNILSDGRYGDTWLVTPGHNVFRHPVAMAREGVGNTESLRLLGHVDVNWALPYGFEYNMNVAANKYDVLESRFEPDVFYWNPRTDESRRLRFDDRNAYREDLNNLDITFFQTLGWSGGLADHSDIEALLGFSRETFLSRGFNARREGFFSNELYDLNAGSINDRARGSTEESALMSYFGRVNYTLLEKYLLEFNFRYDGSSRFAEGNRWGFFPSISGAWRISEESFMRDVETVDELKLRASWGTLGNQDIPLFGYTSIVELDEAHVFNNNLVPGAAVTALSDPGITWETTTIANVGVDVGLLDQRLELTADVYDKKTTDILTRINVPAQVGNLEGPITNLYSMSNRGFEIGASFRNFVGDDFNYRVGGNAAYVDNKVDFLSGDLQLVTNTLWGPMHIIAEDHPVRSYYVLDAEGIFQSEEEVERHADQGPDTQPGDLKYRDVDENGVINSDDRIITGSSIPNWTYAFNVGVDFKGFDIAAFFQGVLGVDTYPTHNNAYPLYNGAGITREHLDYWTPENTDAAYPRIGLPRRGTQKNYQLSTFWLQDASYLRFKNLQIGYTIPVSISEKFSVRRVRAYLNAQNLYTWTSFDISDPEKQITQPNLFGYPTVATYSIGINVGF